MFKVLLISFLAFFGLCFGRNLNVTLNDNPLFTCFTNPCVYVDGVGKIMGSTKVRMGSYPVEGPGPEGRRG